jgi:RHS repeat-associated protein
LWSNVFIQRRTRSLTYDEQGNTTKRYGPTGIAQSLTWDIEGELTRLTEGTKATDYLYDANGDLLIRRGPDKSVLYLADQELHYDTAAKKFSAQRYYPAGDISAVRTETSLTWMVDDHHGTASMAVDATTQAITRRYTKPFGETRGMTPPAWPDDKGFLGKPTDVGTGLTHVGAREYDPATGRLLSVDPVLAPDDHESLNGYAYANNTPVTKSDPTGLRPITDCERGCSDGKGGTYHDSMRMGPNGTWVYQSSDTYVTKVPGTSSTYISATVQTRGGKTTSVNVVVFKKGPNPAPDRKDGKKGSGDAVTADLSAEDLVAVWAMGGPTEITLPSDGEFVRQLRTEDHFRSFTGMMRGLIKDGVYQAEGSFNKSHAKRNDFEKAWEGLTDVTGFFTGGIYGGSPASLALGSYNLDYELLGVSCRPPQTDSEWDHGALVGQVKVEVSNRMTVASATRSLSDDGYKNGSSNPVMKAGSDAVKRIFPDGQRDINVKITWIEEVYVPY